MAALMALHTTKDRQIHAHVHASALSVRLSHAIVRITAHKPQSPDDMSTLCHTLRKETNNELKKKPKDPVALSFEKQISSVPCLLYVRAA